MVARFEILMKASEHKRYLCKVSNSLFLRPGSVPPSRSVRGEWLVLPSFSKYPLQGTLLGIRGDGKIVVTAPDGIYVTLDVAFGMAQVSQCLSRHLQSAFQFGIDDMLST